MTNIVVCAKYVPDATADRTFEDDDTVDRGAGLLYELDEYAVEPCQGDREIKAESGADLVVCGMAATDAPGSVVPAMPAERAPAAGPSSPG